MCFLGIKPFALLMYCGVLYSTGTTCTSHDILWPEDEATPHADNLKYSTYQEAFIAAWNGKWHFSRHASRTSALLTGNQAGLHWSLHLAASNPQITANFTMNHGGRLPRTPFIHMNDTFSAHYLFLVFSFFCLSRSHSTFLLTTTLDIRCFLACVYCSGLWWTACHSCILCKS